MSKGDADESGQSVGAQPDSKSARKREAHRVQALGWELAELSDAQRTKIPLGEDLERAIIDYRRFTSHEARRRQLQLIGKLMRGEDSDAIAAALADARASGAKAKHLLHDAERWRERLLADDAALTEYLEMHPTREVQVLRNLIRSARRQREHSGPYRALFRFLRSNQADDSTPPSSAPPTDGDEPID